MTEQPINDPGSSPGDLKDPTITIHLQTIRDGAVSITISEQSNGEQIEVNASIGKVYKDLETGLWHESRHFNPQEIQKLQNLLPYAHLELKRWQGYYVQTQPPAQPQQDSQAGLKRDAVSGQQVQQQGQELSAQRDAVMQQANPQGDALQVQPVSVRERFQEHSR